MKNRVSLQRSRPRAKGGHNPGKTVPQQPSGMVRATGLIDSLAITMQRQGQELGPRSIQKL